MGLLESAVNHTRAPFDYSIHSKVHLSSSKLSSPTTINSLLKKVNTYSSCGSWASHLPGQNILFLITAILQNCHCPVAFVVVIQFDDDKRNRTLSVLPISFVVTPQTKFTHLSFSAL